MIFFVIPIVFGVGVAITFTRLASYRHSPSRTAHREAMILAMGFGGTWLAVILVSILGSAGKLANPTAIAFGTIGSVIAAGGVYGVARLQLWIRGIISKWVNARHLQPTATPQVQPRENSQASKSPTMPKTKQKHR